MPAEEREYDPPMPMLSYYRLLIEGPAARVIEFRADRAVWNVEPWAAFFGGHLREERMSGSSWNFGGDLRLTVRR